MSRIAGIIGGSSAERHDQLQRMLAAALPPGQIWRTASHDSGNAGVGWTGWREADCAELGGDIAAADGFVYNGDELGVAGLSTAVAILTLFQRHGFEGALAKINGDFAVAVYDAKEVVLWLGTDRVLTRPLYYTQTRDSFLFASQPRSLLSVPGVSRAPNREFVALFGGSHYRTVDNAIHDSPFAALRRLPAAHALRVSKGVAREVCYWRLTDAPDHTEPEATLAEQYRALLLDATARRFAAADKPAFTLSGGMDSSSVLACAVKNTGRKLPAISVGYVDRTYDESDEVQAMLEPTVSIWHKLTVDKPDVFGTIEKMVAVQDEPVVTATWLSHYMMSEEASRLGYGALFGGLGGDELNAGEYEHFWHFFADLKTGGHLAQLGLEVEMWAANHDHPIFKKSSAIMEQNLPRLADLSVPGRCLPDRLRIERYADALDLGFFDLRKYTPVMDHPFRSYLKNRTYQDMMRETIPCCLRAEDRHTVSFGMDNFVPFFDHRLIEFMFRVPGTMKFRDGVSKHLLREAMAGVLPEETRTRFKKAGWNAPAHIWFTTTAREPLRDMIASRKFRERGIFNLKEIERLLVEHEAIVADQQRVDNHMMFFWQLVNVELWLRSIEAMPT